MTGESTKVVFEETEGDGFEKRGDGVFTLEETIVAVRGPFKDGYREVDIRKADGSVGTAALSSDQFAALERASENQS